MIKWKNFFVVFSVVFVFSLGFILVGCSSEATPEQLQKIKELEAEVKSLDQSIKTKEAEKANLERDVNELDGKLQNCEKEKQLVKDRLATWKEPAPEPVDQPVDKKATKKKKTK
jgi:chromosome segregation ATPase